MKRSTFFLIVIGAGIIIIFVLIFMIFSNPYERLNPPAEEPVAAEAAGVPTTEEEPTAELITIWEGPTSGATTGVDGIRLVFLDKETSTIKVTEFDGTGEQKLSDTFVGVQDFAVSPTKDRAWLQLNDPDSETLITLIYEFRTKNAVRLEDGIRAIDFSPDGSQVVYHVSREGTAPKIRTTPVSSLAPVTIKDNFVALNPVLRWYADDRIAFWLSPSSERPSSIITMTTTGTETVELISEAPAMQAKFSPDGTKALVSYNNPATEKPVMLMVDTNTKETTNVSLSTWVDKCDWADDSLLAICFEPQNLPAGFVYPSDDLTLDYQDTLWSLEAATSKPIKIYETPAEILDASQPILSQDNKRVTFWDRALDNLVSLDLADKLFPVAPETEEVPSI